MAIKRQQHGTKGSKKHLQYLINTKPEIINKQMKVVCNGADIHWLSPLKSDYSEFSDGDFLELVGLANLRPNLRAFWPNGGPNWDALGRSGDKVFLVEAKSHIDELVSPPTKASNESRKIIENSFSEVKRFLNVAEKEIWTEKFYQYTNRIAHLFFLRQVNNVPAHLILLYFINDEDFVDSPKTKAEWEVACRVTEVFLGLSSHKLKKFITRVYVDVKKLYS